jgi:hypothetical protein
MLASMTWQQLRDWQEYYSLEPFGEEAAWLRNGMLCSLIYGANRGTNSPVKTPIDFMPFADNGKARRSGAKGAKVTRDEQAASWSSFVGNIKKHLKPSRRDKEH